MNTPIPIEKCDPGFASLLKWWCNSDNSQGIHIDCTPEPEPEPIKAEIKIGRNSPCVCGSGKKYKKCCMKNNS